jgi:hypothetical protein
MFAACPRQISAAGFRDTEWIALLIRSLAPAPLVVTTEEVLTQFLTYLSGGAILRMKAAASAYALQDGPDVRFLPQSFAGLRLCAECPDKVYALEEHPEGIEKLSAYSIY